MKEYVDFVFRKEKKPFDIEKLFNRIVDIIRKDSPSYELTCEDKEEILKIVEEGINNYTYYKNENGKFLAFYKTSFRYGRFYGNKAGEGYINYTNSYVDREGMRVVTEEKINITKENCNGAVDGDIVLVDVGGNGLKPVVTKIIERNLENVAGEVIRIGNGYFVQPIDKKKKNLNIALEGEAIEGQRVLVTLKEQTSNNFYIGEIIKVFNHKDDPDDDILWEAYRCGIDDHFSEESLRQVEFIPQSVSEQDKIGREDLTSWEIFTIDGDDTKDIDDALSCRKLANGNYEVGVHIADVSYYVPENSALDKDAFKKGTSNYLAGKVIPMLPHELSNGICSLNPNVERLAMSCIMELDMNGNIVNYRVSPTVIKSQLKMTYKKVNDLLKFGIVSDEYESHADTLRLLNKIALILRKNRLLSGSVEFDKPELKIICDENGKVVDFSVRKQDVGENLIEEFMLLANECVDRHLEKSGFPCLHRVHDKPSSEKLEEFLKLLVAVNLPYSKYNIDQLVNSPIALQDLSDFIKNTGNIQNMLSINMVKCMSRAKYSPINIGHRGLAKKNYCHFTSPIRRYPDLTVHRIIKDCCLDRENAIKNSLKWGKKLVEIGDQSSRMERIADECEQQTLSMKCSEYMQGHIGEIFEGTIIGLSDRGIVVQLDNMIEGRVRPRDMVGQYVYNPDSYTLLSENNGVNYYIGDRLSLRLKVASKYDKIIDFEIVEKLVENKTRDVENTNVLVKRKYSE